MARPNSPGPDGYLVAWLVSVVVYASVFAVGTSIADHTGIGTAAGVFVIYGGFIGMFSIPFALVGVGLVHLACGRVRGQWVHVVAAGGVGAFPAALMVAAAPQLDAWVWWMIPVSTAIGRWSVIPLVRRRQRGCYHPRPGQVPGPSMDP